MHNDKIIIEYRIIYDNIYKMSFKIIKPLKSIEKLCLYNKIPSFANSLKYKESWQIFELINYRSSKARYTDNDGFILSPSIELKRLFGSNYSEGIRELVYWNLIEPKWYNDDNSSYKYSYDKGIACSYRISSVAKELLKKHFDYVENVFLYKIPKGKNGKFKLETPSCDPKNIKLLDSYQGISIEPDWLDIFRNLKHYPPDHYKYPSEPIARTGLFFHSKGLVESIIKKTIPVKTNSKCGRAFHPIIEMSKILRPYIRKNGEKLVNIDAKSFHPYLIASCISDINEREKYLDIVRGGFYEKFEDTNHSRDLIKVAFQKYLSGRPTLDSKVWEISRWFEAAFPEVPLKMIQLKKKRTTFQMYLQQLESRIFVDEVFMKAKFWCLPMHDGICLLERDIDAASDIIESACQLRLGYSIPVEISI
jgi:hypothetical protein